MFVCVARVSLETSSNGSLKAKRQVVRRITERAKARFNVSVVEIDEPEASHRATLAMAVVGNERAHVNEQMDKIFQLIEDMYVAPVISREMEIITLGDTLFGDVDREGVQSLTIPKGERSLAEAEGMASWEHRHLPPVPQPQPAETKGNKGAKLSLEEARAKARSLRKRRDWEKEKGS